MRRASKLLITMLTLTVLFAIFAFSASAAEEITWDSNTAFGTANFDVSSDCTITVSGELSVEAQIRIRNGAKVTIKGDPTNGGTLKATGTKGQMFLVNNASVTFENITLDGGSKSRVIYVYDAAASATINAGTVIKGGKTTGTNPGAGIYNKGTVVMNGGSIESNNSASQAGGVYLYGGSSFTMNGGEIKNTTGWNSNGTVVGIYDGVFTSLLGRTVVVENLDDAIRIARKYGRRFKIVTIDGQVMNAGGSMTGGSTSKNAGILSRANELESLAKKKQEIADNAAETAKIAE